MLPAWMPRLARRGWDFVHFVAKHFDRDDCLRTASALAYTSLLSLVPLLATVFSMFSAFPMFREVEENLRNFIFSNFVPAAGEVIQTYVQNFMQQTSKLTIVGILFLFITALLLMQTIDSALNGIWHIRRKRKAISSFMVYWAALTLGPVLIGASIFITSYIISQPWFFQMEKSTWQTFLSWLPFLTTATAFSLLYIVVPNRAVPWRPAIIGGVIAAVCFEIAKKGFALYVLYSTGYQTLYGTLAAVPIFLMWIYLSWVMILLGAEIAYCLTIFRWNEKYRAMHENDSQFMHAYRVLGKLWQAQRLGDAADTETLLGANNWNDEYTLHIVLEKLEAAQWVARAESGEWMLSRDLGETSLLELYRLLSGGLFSLAAQDGDAWSQSLQIVLEKFNGCTTELMSLPLKELYRDAT